MYCKIHDIHAETPLPVTEQLHFISSQVFLALCLTSIVVYSSSEYFYALEIFFEMFLHDLHCAQFRERCYIMRVAIAVISVQCGQTTFSSSKNVSVAVDHPLVLEWD